MADTVGEILNNVTAGGTASLPCGEFEGPFVITTPCTVMGNNTTLWVKSGTVLTVSAPNVRLKNLRIELTGQPRDNASFAIVCTAPGVTAENVEIIGAVRGMGSEDGYWGVPVNIKLGKFPDGQKNTFKMELCVPSETEIISTAKDVSFSPAKIPAGASTVTITSEPLRRGTYLYGDVIFKSELNRRAYIFGTADGDAGSFTDGAAVFKAAPNMAPIPNEGRSVVLTRDQLLGYNKVSRPSEKTVPTGATVPLTRGQRISAADYLGNTAEISFSASFPSDMEIDAYTFMLDKNAKAAEDDCLVFFGNTRSKCGSVSYDDKSPYRTVTVDFTKIPEHIERISLAYSVYGDDPRQNFSKVKGLTFTLKGKNTLVFSPDNLLMETTIVAVEFYRYKNSWKLCCVGAGYRDGLRRLCESTGLQIV